MDVDKARDRKHVMVAMLYALEHPAELFAVCAAADGDFESASVAITEAFGFDEIQAHAVLDLQVRRFTPQAIERLRTEVASVDAALRR